ncbi:SDR family oxidoreductase [Tenacibaculum aiptasiae]|uniref:SDR family oxidoreductase n=1 Tax=Tenacibaculum aiptasiae TaxID=426481 RepID=A0A7J5AI24_9FLAO|nr:SDR family oxidoreductase [Tenacibaculum aiptasiae]KAB1157251.1 SDR family oxidoreductase [Tenacibaculum aiptasiae]
MKILITGTTGYVGKRIIPILLQEGHTLVCCVRDLNRIPLELKAKKEISFVEIDFLKPENQLPKDIDAAYYLIHSMSTSSDDFESLEEKCAKNFKELVEKTTCKQVIYLSGIVNDNSLSKHLQSRYKVEQILSSKEYGLTTFRAGIVVGSGSASFEIIRDLVEKLPIMVAPRWLHTKTQPIAIRDVLSYLTKSLFNEKVYNKSYDIFGPEVLTYKEMLLQFAEVRKLKRIIITLPVLTPKLSSYWLYFVTSTSFNLAKTLVDSMKVEVIGRESNINKIISVKPITYKEAVDRAFKKIAQNSMISSWKDAKISGVFKKEYSDYIELPHFGCFKDVRSRYVKDEPETLHKIWSIGGKTGWYRFNTLWKIRGYIDKVFGGVGLRRGRRHPTELEPGDALDFWRVLLADQQNKRLLLFAEMKLPGEAWLEYKIVKNKLYQRAVFRPKGILGRMYWFLVLPFHGFIFRGLINYLSK